MASAWRYGATSTAAAAPPRDSQHREMMQRLQSEFSRVVATLEARNASLVQHNELLTTELQELRQQIIDTNGAMQRQQTAHADAMRSAEEQTAMALEDANSSRQQAAESSRQLRATCEQLENSLKMQRNEWETERSAWETELQRVGKQLEHATAKLAREQRSNATMSQELQLLQCRVDSAVKTSQAFEQRLQQLKQLKRDEKTDMDAHISHLQKRLEDKKEQNRYLAEALMERDSRRPSTTTKDPASAAKHTTPTTDRARRREAELKATTATATTESKRRHEYRLEYAQNKPHRSTVEDLHSHAPTSPTSSSSPPSTPSMTMRSIPRDRHLRPPVASSTVTRKSSITSSVMAPVPPATAVAMPSSATRTSERMQRELLDLRRKLQACMHSSDDDAR